VFAVPAAARGQKCSPDGAYSDHWEQRGAMLEQQHKKLHEALKLTAAQEGPWKKLVDAEMPMAKAPVKPESWDKLTTPERAEKMLERMKERQGAMTDHLAALKEFYAALSAEQKKTFDDFHVRAWNEMGGKMMRRGMPAEKAAKKP
jgi:hypothetical protein